MWYIESWTAVAVVVVKKSSGIVELPESVLGTNYDPGDHEIIAGWSAAVSSGAFRRTIHGQSSWVRLL